MTPVTLPTTAAAPLRHVLETPMPAVHAEATCRRLTKDHDEFHRLKVVTFPIFLAAAIVRRALPQRRHVSAYMSIIHDAKAMADSALPFAYMG